MKNIHSDVSVIICAYTEERWQDILLAIRSAQQQQPAPREIILVVDHNSRLFASARAHIEGCIVIENTHPRGLSGARNSGIEIAQGSLIAFLDDDATAESDWLARLCLCCQDDNVLGAGGVVEPLWSGKRPAWFPREFYWVVGCTYDWSFTRPTAVRNPYGGCTCIRSEVFAEIGGFTDGIGRVGARPMGGEETELCIRARQRWPHKVFLHDPHARIHHHIPARRALWSYFYARCYAEGQSKAQIARLVGRKDGLASERSYTCKILPSGILAGLAGAIFHSDPMGFLRAGAIIAGLAITTAGYLAGTIFPRTYQDQATQNKNTHHLQMYPHLKN